ncbi:MAG: hypothetical protein LH468_05970 [Nocardioides sp.]|nr:hypothetical protein [Nocardioides sp.]
MAKILGSPEAPPATRASGPGWRDPRLWIGVAIVAASVVAGARLFASADDTVAVWAATARHGAGDQLDQADLTSVRIHFAEAGTVDGYVTLDQQLPADLVLSRGIEAGELLPRASVGTSVESGLVQVPIAVEPEQVPGSVAAGAVVDVYLVAPAVAGAPVGSGPGAGDPSAGAAAASAAPALSEVTVLEAPRPSESFGTSGKRQLVLAVPEGSATAFFQLLGASQGAVITVVRRG